MIIKFKVGFTKNKNKKGLSSRRNVFGTLREGEKKRDGYNQ